MPDPTVSRLRPAELKTLLDTGAPLVLLDVREDDERAYCSIPLPSTAADLHVPMGQVPSRLDEIGAAVSRSSPTPPLVVYCHHGVRSMAVARFLASRGVSSVLNLTGGIDAWSAEVDPAVRRYSSI